MIVKRDQFNKIEEISGYDTNVITDREVMEKIFLNDKFIDEEITKRTIAVEESKLKWNTILEIGIPIATAIVTYVTYVTGTKPEENKQVKDGDAENKVDMNTQ